MSRQGNSRLSGRVERQNDMEDGFSRMTMGMNNGRYMNRGSYAGGGGYNNNYNNRGNRGYAQGPGYSGGYNRRGGGGYDRRQTSSRSSGMGTGEESESRADTYVSSEDSANEDDSRRSSPTSGSRQQSIYPEPQFSDIEKATEKVTLEIIHQVVKDKAPQSIDILFDLVSSAANIRQKLLFRTIAELQEYLNDRRFLFFTGIGTKKILNMGFGHRKGIRKIVMFIREKSVHLHGCRLSTLFYYIKNEPRFPVYMEAKWQGQPWNDSYFFYEQVPDMNTLYELLIYGHPELFEVNAIDGDFANGFVKLKRAAFRVPSLWDRALLPKKPCEQYWDKSRSDSYYCRPTTVLEGYMKGEIQVGDFSGRKIYILAKELGLTDSDLRSHYIAKVSMMAVEASFTMNHASDVRGTRVKLLERPNNKDTLQRRRATFDVDSKFESSFFFVEILEIWRWFSEDPEVAPVASAVSDEDRLHLRRAANTEMERTKFVDQIVGDEHLTADEIRNRIVGIKGSPFTETWEIIEFIKGRPHLYMTDHVTTTAFALPKFDRDLYNVFFRHLSQSGARGITRNELQANIKGARWGEALQAMALEQQLAEFMNHAKCLFDETTLLHPAETRIVLHGTFLTAERLLVPNVILGLRNC